MIDLLTILKQLDEAGATFRSLGEAIETESAAGRMMMQMLGCFAQFEREIIVERSTEVWHTQPLLDCHRTRWIAPAFLNPLAVVEARGAAVGRQSGGKPLQSPAHRESYSYWDDLQAPARTSFIS